MDTVVIRCKDCGRVFYANTRLKPADVPDIVEYAKQGHEVSVVDAPIVWATCGCGNRG